MNNDFIKFCHYYKGEDKCPFPYEKRVKHVLWNIEKMYVELDDEIKKEWENYVRMYVRDNKGKKNALTSNLPIETRGIIAYADTMIAKWIPNESNIIEDYGKE